ncbi:uncharacterized protein LOC128549378 [Mercenaria mercenaria]|uniref:uncharacterized protein LOC128549378 n=1 Tax=Mercenaria mercenaria TaxID=6596 RepID=UPI00234F4D74|nr:uncharacterized protein LOC128549378 [Mercenaria mercenaria]
MDSVKDYDDTQEQNQIGRLVEVTYKEGGNGKPGIDLALFKIDKRPPSEGTFPDIQGTTTRIRYDSGKVWGKEGVPPNQPQVQKFGFVTGLTYGEIQFDNGVVREKPFHSEMELETTKYTTTLYNQYLIKSNDVNVQFSKLGDSGALVFMKDNTGEENDLRCIGMVVGVLNDNLCAVTPITAILEELKVTTLKSFVPTWEQIEGRLREMEERLENVITRTVNAAVTNALASRQNPS